MQPQVHAKSPEGKQPSFQPAIIILGCNKKFQTKAPMLNAAPGLAATLFCPRTLVTGTSLDDVTVPAHFIVVSSSLFPLISLKKAKPN